MTCMNAGKIPKTIIELVKNYANGGKMFNKDSLIGYYEYKKNLILQNDESND